jgi:hypothetical protein
LARHGEQRRVVVERFARVSSHLGHRVAKVRERLRAHVEPQDVPFPSRVGWIIRPIARCMPGHEVLDLSHAE